MSRSSKELDIVIPGLTTLLVNGSGAMGFSENTKNRKHYKKDAEWNLKGLEMALQPSLARGLFKKAHCRYNTVERLRAKLRAKQEAQQ
jgi:hypothetical protein